MTHEYFKCLFKLDLRSVPLYERPQSFGQNGGLLRLAIFKNSLIWLSENLNYFIN